MFLVLIIRISKQIFKPRLRSGFFVCGGFAEVKMFENMLTGGGALAEITYGCKF